MYENKEEYEAIVRRRLIALEWAVGHPIEHGAGGLCPRCGLSGNFDVEGLGFSRGNSIYFSTVYQEWRCRVCDYRTIH
ncbi:MAG: hypothetical protein IH614_18075 [Desulfuromonadales bacterium]|nr:hypothetical protein [Desulfuromonadales bacterium]